jgi:hypothetical protein
MLELDEEHLIWEEYLSTLCKEWDLWDMVYLLNMWKARMQIL